MSTRAHSRFVVAVGFVLSAALSACTAPGCIRHSECGHGYICKRSMCVVEPPDGSTSEPELPDDELDSGFE